MRPIIVCLVVLCASTASAQWPPELATELSVGASIGAGWYQWAARSYQDGATNSFLYGMDATFGVTGRWGVSTAAPGLALLFSVQGDLLSSSDQVKRFLISDGAAMFGLRIPLREDYGQISLAGLFGLAFSTLGVRGPGLTFGGCVVYRRDHLFLETRYQAFAFTLRSDAPDAGRTDVTIHQLLANLGVAL